MRDGLCMVIDRNHVVYVMNGDHDREGFVLVFFAGFTRHFRQSAGHKRKSFEGNILFYNL